MGHTAKYLYALLLLIPLLAAGCSIRDYLGDCPPKVNTTVRFSLEDYDGNDIFPTEVDRVELFVHDSEGRLVSRSTVSKSELDAFAGKRLSLDPGTYTVVVWANAARSRIVADGNTHWSDRDRNHLVTAVEADGVIDNGDPLWYAPEKNGTPLTVVVPERGEVEVTAALRHAHVKLDITLVGYNDGTNDPLRIEVAGLTSRYDFGMNAHGERVSYIGSATNTGVADEFKGVFNIPVFDRDTPILFTITNSDGNQIHPAAIRLSGLLDGSIDVETLRYLPLVIRFEGGTDPGTDMNVVVTVDLPGWGEDVVTPNV